MKTVGIVAHSAEGGTLCFITACREGQKLLGPHMHPEIVVSAIPMGLSMPGWESGDHQAVAHLLRRGVEQVAETLPIPGLHIADVVALEMKAAGWKVAGLLGTKWTMTGPVYPRALHK